jgi:hypothetical protein
VRWPQQPTRPCASSHPPRSPPFCAAVDRRGRVQGDVLSMLQSGPRTCRRRRGDSGAT